MMRFMAPLGSYTYLNNSLTITYVKAGSGELFWKNGNRRRIVVEKNRFVVVDAGCGWDYVNTHGTDLDILSWVISDETLKQFDFFVSHGDAKLLETPFEQTIGRTFYLENSLNARHYETGQFLQRIYSKSMTHDFDSISAEEASVELLQKLYSDANGLLALSKKIKAKKKSTQIETLRRLSVIREFIHDNVNNIFTLSDISRVSSLSKHHLYNSFKRVYGKTPYQYTNALKIKKSKEYLLTGNFSAREVSIMMGFNDYAVFSKLFKRIDGKNPSSYY